MRTPFPLPHPLLRPLLALVLVGAASAAPAQDGAAVAGEQPAVTKGRIQQRTYHFAAAAKDIEYALFVPRSYDGEQPAPLVVLLHGLGSNPRQVMGYRGITDEADARGYVVVAPYGYNSRGWYGSRGEGKRGAFFGRAQDPDNLGQLSEQDVLNVLDIVLADLAIDRDRVYLMGHSMGGAGTVWLGSKYADRWAALAPLAPALDGRTELLDAMRHLPVMLVTGDRDRLVPVANVRRWVAAMEQREMALTYEEIEGGDHVRAIARNPEMIGRVFAFFDQHARGPRDGSEREAADTDDAPDAGDGKQQRTEPPAEVGAGR